VARSVGDVGVSGEGRLTGGTGRGTRPAKVKVEGCVAGWGLASVLGPVHGGIMGVVVLMGVSSVQSIWVGWSSSAAG
jgi:hypothetical protein